MRKPYKILHLEDSKSDADLVKRVLFRSGINFSYTLAEDKESYIAALEDFKPDVILSDHTLPAFNSKKAFVLAKEKDPDILFILVTGTVSEEFAVDMLKMGIDDYLLKTNLQRLPIAIENALSKTETNKKIRNMRWELQQSETHLRSIFDNSQAGLILLDKNCNILEVNNRTNYFAKQLFDLCLNKADNLLEKLPAQRKQEFGNKIEITLKGEADNYETECLQENGDKVFFHIKFYPVVDPAGEITGVCINLEEITDRKNAEAKTKAAIERYDILAQATSDTIWDWDIINNTMLYNEGMYKMFGYDASQVENVVDWWHNKIHPEDFKKVTELLSEVFANKWQNFQSTYRFRCADNTFKYIFDRAFVLFDNNGKPTRMIGAMQDITSEVEEEKRISKAIIDAQEQERNYIGAELHDNINQILAGTLLTLSRAKSKELDTHMQTEFIELAMTHLTVALNETRKLSHNLAPAGFGDRSLKEIFEDLLFSINLDNRFVIHLHFDELHEMLLPEIIQINLYRIVQEQTKNIMKHAEASDIEISLKKTANTLSLRIFDNGKGFNPKTIKKGIGLSNIKKRAEALNGRFILNSEPDKGCEITIEIPLDL
jgi:two-component system sensor histidine kinase UhpB